MTCPQCGNSDIRHSHSSHWSDGLYSALGREAYRCRKCRRRFFLPRVTEIAGHIKGQSNRGNKDAKHLNFRKRKRLVRRLITIAVFVVMFSLFGLFLRRLTEDHQAPSSSQDAGSSDQ